MRSRIPKSPKHPWRRSGVFLPPPTSPRIRISTRSARQITLQHAVTTSGAESSCFVTIWQTRLGRSIRSAKPSRSIQTTHKHMRCWLRQVSFAQLRILILDGLSKPRQLLRPLYELHRCFQKPNSRTGETSGNAATCELRLIRT